MISATIEKEDKITCFPKIRKLITSEVYVLFKSDYHGTVVKHLDSSMIGEFSRDWDPAMFEDFDGAITLQNE